jgi:predicted hydrolase (HD superfamily)
VAYVRPSGLEGMKPKSVRKKLKSKNFAAGVSREDIDQGAELLEMDLNEHITEVITALQKAAE